MKWSCVKCGHTNPNTEQDCQRCGARLPFRPPAESTEQTDAPETFRVPRTGELTALLYQGIEQLRAGNLSMEAFQERIEAALENVPAVFAAVIDAVQDDSEELTGYGDGVCVSLLDCQALFESGLSELLHFVEDGDDFHLRFGWLLLEKGEQEYVTILETLKRDAANHPFDGADNVVGRLYEGVRNGSLSEEAYESELKRFEDVSLSALGEVAKLLTTSVELAAKKDDESFSEAMDQLQQASDKMGQILLNLYAVESMETAG